MIIDKFIKIREYKLFITTTLNIEIESNIFYQNYIINKNNKK